MNIYTQYKKITFWPLQIYGWLVFSIVIYFKVASETSHLDLVLVYTLFASLTGFTLTSMGRTYFKKIKIVEKSFITIVVSAIFASILGGAFSAVLHLYIYPKIIESYLIIHTFPLVALNHIFVSLLWTTIYMMLNFFQATNIEFQKRTLITEKMKSEQLKTLRFQLKPHFLFNVLSSLHYLIKDSPGKAREMTLHLSKYFQHILSDDSQEIIPLINEINLIIEYFELQKIRFENMLQTSIACDKKLMSLKIPGMIIFPLIENAVKYGYNTHTGKYSIDLNIREENNHHLIIIVKNDGKWVQETMIKRDTEFHEYDGGIGLENIRQRLKLHYNDDWSLSHTEKNEKVIVTLRIPLL